MPGSSDKGPIDLDLDAIARAITSRTRIVIDNSPHNPTGRVYSSEVLAGLAALEAASTRRAVGALAEVDRPRRKRSSWSTGFSLA
jgi:aspartate aminotransferase